MGASRHLLGLAGVAGIVLTALLAGHWPSTTPDTPVLPRIFSATDAPCPQGFKRKDPVHFAREFRPDLSAAHVADIRDTWGEEICLSAKHPESMFELTMIHTDHAHSAGHVPEGAYRRAIEAKAAMQDAKQDVAGADGDWQPYAIGPLVSNDPRFGGSKDYVDLNGRVDDFEYDPESGRIFATVGTGGVWMTEDMGDNWVSIGDNLPSQIVGGVAWTPAGGGTLVAVSGEPIPGGNVYVGLGAFWSNDLGLTWHQSEGVPDGALGFRAVADKSNPEVVYVANSKGLFRSSDAGRSFVNVNLPTSPECAGVTELGPCQYANFVTDVLVKEPGGTTAAEGGEVLAVVGYRSSSRATFPDGTPHAPGNGFYYSATGEPDSFALAGTYTPAGGIEPVGLPERARIGRVEMGAAIGPEQDHNIVYAIVQDAVMLEGGYPYIDIQPLDDVQNESPIPPYTTSFNGIYMSPDFGQTWLQIATTSEIADNPATGSNLAIIFRALVGFQSGVQAWYNMYVKPDPTRAGPLGFPTRLVFGLEEVYRNRLTDVPLNGVLQQGPNDFQVIGTYFAGCQVLLNTEYCPTNDPLETPQTTTHPDHHDALWVPTEDGGVCLFVGHDGGVNRQCVAAGEDPGNTGWGDGANNGFNTLLPYHLAVANDGTVWMGLQDNGTAKIEGGTRRQFMTFGGDGFFAAVDPRNPNFAYGETTYADMRVTLDGGLSWADMNPPVAGPANGSSFSNPFVMDPTDPNHMMTGGYAIVETIDGPRTRGPNWVQTIDMGEAPNGHLFKMTAVELQAEAAYAGACANCSTFRAPDEGFFNAIVTNVGGDAPARKASPDGWHHAAIQGLPNRYITSIEIDQDDPNTVYVAVGGYSNAQWVQPGGYLDATRTDTVGHIFKSTDAAESFVDISGNLPNARATWVIRRGGQLIAGTDVGPFISADLDGSSWAPLGNGLPNVTVSAMQLKPNDHDKLFISTFGRGVWTYDFAAAGNSVEGRVELPGEDGAAGLDERGGALGCGLLLLLTLAGLGRRRRGRR